MPPNGLDDVLVKVTRIAQDRSGNVVGVLQSTEDGVDKGDLGPLLEGARVQAVDPVMVLGRQVLGHVVLEDNDVRVWNVDGSLRGDQRSDLVRLRLEHG